MLDTKKQLVTTLTTVGIPVQYELFCDKTTKPCITYQESNNYDMYIGDTLGYSVIRYTVKLWGDNLSTLMTYAESVDEKLKAIGYKRISANELTADTQICLIYMYEGIGQEITSKGE